MVDPDIWLVNARDVARRVLADEPVESWREEMQRAFEGVFSLPDDLTEPFRYMYGAVTEIEKPRIPMTEEDAGEIEHYRALLREQAESLLTRP